MGGAEVGDRVGPPDGAGDPVAAGEELFGEQAAEAAAHPGHEPGACHDPSVGRRRSGNQAALRGVPAGPGTTVPGSPTVGA
ncbi:hypothetical protein GCM10023328_20120 [Modestobacter marinus]|uniref:Uncharacterized protein n=1 Tax=Modestobacter marinus TaxID=477641 RepID=A0ABQ2FY08_9ACTN|nr:hypothetical protein GCM10011589_22330 [Modestobacter marinus]